MSAFTEAQENRIRQIIDEQLERFLRYQLRAFEAPDVTKTPPAPQQPTTPTKHILAELPKEQSDLLEASRKDNTWIIHTTGYLKPQSFKEVCTYFEKQGGKYIPATTNEHPYWAVPVKP